MPEQSKTVLHPDFFALIERYNTDTRFTEKERLDMHANLDMVRRVFEGIPVPARTQAVLLTGSYSRANKKPRYDEDTSASFNSDIDIMVLKKRYPFFVRPFQRLYRFMTIGSLQGPDSWWSEEINKRLTELHNTRRIDIRPYAVQDPFLNTDQKEWVNVGTLLYGSLPRRLARRYQTWIYGGSSKQAKSGEQPSARW